MTMHLTLQFHSSLVWKWFLMEEYISPLCFLWVFLFQVWFAYWYFFVCQLFYVFISFWTFIRVSLTLNVEMCICCNKNVTVNVFLAYYLPIIAPNYWNISLLKSLPLHYDEVIDDGKETKIEMLSMKAEVSAIGIIIKQTFQIVYSILKLQHLLAYNLILNEILKWIHKFHTKKYISCNLFKTSMRECKNKISRMVVFYTHKSQFKFTYWNLFLVL